MGLLGKLVLYGVIAATGAAFATRPSVEEVREMYRDRVAGEIADGSILSAESGAAQTALAACQVTPANCARLLEGVISFDYENRYLFATVETQSPFFEPRNCIAVFERLFCR
jgi:hypothetical protein